MPRPVGPVSRTSLFENLTLAQDQHLVAFRWIILTAFTNAITAQYVYKDNCNTRNLQRTVVGRSRLPVGAEHCVTLCDRRVFVDQTRPHSGDCAVGRGPAGSAGRSDGLGYQATGASGSCPPTVGTPGPETPSL